MFVGWKKKTPVLYDTPVFPQTPPPTKLRHCKYVYTYTRSKHGPAGLHGR